MASPASDRPAERRAREGRVVFRASDDEIAALDARGQIAAFEARQTTALARLRAALR